MYTIFCSVFPSAHEWWTAELLQGGISSKTAISTCDSRSASHAFTWWAFTRRTSLFINFFEWLYALYWIPEAPIVILKQSLKRQKSPTLGQESYKEKMTEERINPTNVRLFRH